MILTIVFGVIAAYLLVFMFIGISSYKRLDFYRKQGIRTFYNPVVGFFKYLITPKGSKDQLEALKKLYVDHNDTEIVAFNSVAAN